MDRRSLSPTEARVVLGLEEEGRAEIDLAGIQRRAAVAPGHARKLAHGLVRKHWLERLGGGRYLLNPAARGPDALPDTDPFRAGSRLVRPYYFGYATAAELWGLLPQAGRVYFIASPTRTLPKIRHAATFRLVHTPVERMWGIAGLERRGERLAVSDRERTVLDCLERPELAGGIPGAFRILEGAMPRFDWKTVAKYLARDGRSSTARRLGFLAERSTPGRPPPAWWVRRYRPGPATPFIPLGPPSRFGRKGPREARWRVIQNVPERVLRAEVDLR